MEIRMKNVSEERGSFETPDSNLCATHLITDQPSLLVCFSLSALEDLIYATGSHLTTS